jgi:hypothetical protein
MKKTLKVILFLVSFSSNSQIIREIPINNLPDIAIASYDNIGPVIYFNPYICQQVGVLTTNFFKAHEYGHHNLGHVYQSLTNRNPYVQGWLSQNGENQADEYALRYWIGQGNIAVIQAAVNSMWNDNNSGDRTHPPSRVRANNIATLYYQFTGQQLF